MRDTTNPLLDRWRRRYWRPDARTASYATLRPITVVTGGSEGLGLALAGAFSQAGSELLLVARNADALAAAAMQLGAGGTRVDTLSADLATEAGCDSLEPALAAIGGYCDILVNNAGIGLSGPFAAQSVAELHRLLDLNIGAATDLMARVLPGMISRGRGGILNVSSLAGLVPGPQQAAYYASKAYLLSLTEALAHETAGQGVRICALLPGPVATKFHARMGAEHSYYLGLIGVAGPERVALAGLRGFRTGQTLIYPSLVDHFNAAVLRSLPHWLSLPMIGWMLRQRRAG